MSSHYEKPFKLYRPAKQKAILDLLENYSLSEMRIIESNHDALFAFAVRHAGAFEAPKTAEFSYSQDVISHSVSSVASTAIRISVRHRGRDMLEMVKLWMAASRREEEESKDD